MKQSLRTCAYLLGVLFAIGSVQAQEVSDGTTLHSVIRELKELKCEVLQQGIELQKLRIGRLERELSDLRSTEQRSEEQTRTFYQHILDINQDLTGPDRSVELNAQRRDGYAFLANVQTSQREISSQTSERETELQHEKERLEKLLEMFRKEKLSVEDNPNQESR